MRTTLTVDDELMQLARQKSVMAHIPLGDVINRALRRGLAEDPVQRTGEPTLCYGDPATPGPDDATLRTWTNRLEDEEAVRQSGLQP